MIRPTKVAGDVGGGDDAVDAVRVERGGGSMPLTSARGWSENAWRRRGKRASGGTRAFEVAVGGEIAAVICRCI